MKPIAIAGALDTKEEEIRFLAAEIAEHKIPTLVIDFGVLGDPQFAAEVSSAEVARAGGAELKYLRESKDKTQAMHVMAAGLRAVVVSLHKGGEISGIVSVGGTSGTAIAASAMRALPVGFPKLIVSTVGGGDVSAYLAGRDITIMPSVVDVAGLNRISRVIFSRAAGAVAGMTAAKIEPDLGDRPLIAASMFGNTTTCVDRARRALDQLGFEVLVFHATGMGGRSMQALAEDGELSGLLDITTTELADEVCGGVFSAGPERVRVGAKQPLPVVIAPGCVDMCNFGSRATVPRRYRHRQLYEWNPNVTLMRTNRDENRRIGGMLAELANLCVGPVSVLIPIKGVSMLDSPGGAFWDTDADGACFEAMRKGIRPDIPVIECDANINDCVFADKAVAELVSLIENRSGGSK